MSLKCHINVTFFPLKFATLVIFKVPSGKDIDDLYENKCPNYI